jgi:hypothetical protein
MAPIDIAPTTTATFIIIPKAVHLEDDYNKIKEFDYITMWLRRTFLGGIRIRRTDYHICCVADDHIFQTFIQLYYMNSGIHPVVRNCIHSIEVMHSFVFF